jgi:hypothetical protein
MNQVVLQALKEESASAPALDVAALILLGPEDVATTLLEIEAPDGKTAIGGFALLGSPGGSTLHQSNAYEGDATARR